MTRRKLSFSEKTAFGLEQAKVRCLKLQGQIHSLLGLNRAPTGRWGSSPAHRRAPEGGFQIQCINSVQRFGPDISAAEAHSHLAEDKKTKQMRTAAPKLEFKHFTCM